MSYALVQDVASSWESYARVAAGLVEPAPDGLILHLAGPTDDGVRVIDVWETEEAWERFRSERLAPALAALGGPSRPEPTVRELRPTQLVRGTGPLTRERPAAASRTAQRQRPHEQEES